MPRPPKQTTIKHAGGGKRTHADILAEIRERHRAAPQAPWKKIEDSYTDDWRFEDAEGDQFVEFFHYSNEGDHEGADEDFFTWAHADIAFLLQALDEPTKRPTLDDARAHLCDLETKAEEEPSPANKAAAESFASHVREREAEEAEESVGPPMKALVCFDQAGASGMVVAWAGDFHPEELQSDDDCATRHFVEASAERGKPVSKFNGAGLLIFEGEAVYDNDMFDTWVGEFRRPEPDEILRYALGGEVFPGDASPPKVQLFMGSPEESDPRQDVVARRLDLSGVKVAYEPGLAIKPSEDASERPAITPERLAEIETRREDAPPLPWRYENRCEFGTIDEHVVDANGLFIGQLVFDGTANMDMDGPTLNYIKAAVQAAPDLCAEVRRLREELTEARKTNEQVEQLLDMEEAWPLLRIVRVFASSPHKATLKLNVTEAQAHASGWDSARKALLFLARIAKKVSGQNIAISKTDGDVWHLEKREKSE